MIVLPVIARELRASARHAFTYNLRTLGVAALILASFFFGVNHGFAPTMGGRLFGSLHFTLFCSIWVLVPLLTADCISRERREGTLGLLFLTALKSSDIVVAKSFAHGLRALTLWLAVLPVVTIPFLMGGLSRSEAVLSASINFSAICWALSAGMLASSWSKTWLRALLGAMFLSFIFLIVLGFLFGGSCLGMASGSSSSVWTWGRQFQRGWRMDSEPILIIGLSLITNAAGDWSDYLPLTAPRQLIAIMAAITLLSLLVLSLAVLICGARTRRIWQEEPPSARQLWLQKTFCTPVFWLSFFKRWMRRKLERNPVGWLEQRTWSGRLVTWGWFAVVISLYSAVLTDRHFFSGGNFIQSIMAWLLAGSMAMSAAGSFRRERESGVLELLLVSPLAEGDIIKGRLRGLWAQFLPAFGTLLGLWAYFLTLDFRERRDAPIIWFYGVTFVTLPIIGLYFSLRCRSFISAFSWTFMVGGLLPVTLPAVLAFVAYLSRNLAGAWFLPHTIGPSIWASLFQIVFAIFCWNWLHQRLRKRAFPLDRAEP
jgi:ABC-type transport system involved in multi-copper enzyme maturation permease subunit